MKRKNGDGMQKNKNKKWSRLDEKDCCDRKKKKKLAMCVPVTQHATSPEFHQE